MCLRWRLGLLWATPVSPALPCRPPCSCRARRLGPVCASHPPHSLLVVFAACPSLVRLQSSQLPPLAAGQLAPCLAAALAARLSAWQRLWRGASRRAHSGGGGHAAPTAASTATAGAPSQPARGRRAAAAGGFKPGLFVWSQHSIGERRAATGASQRATPLPVPSPVSAAADSGAGGETGPLWSSCRGARHGRHAQAAGCNA